MPQINQYPYLYYTPPKSKLPNPFPFIWFVLAAIIVFLLFFQCFANAEISAESAVRAIIGEAANQGYHGMLAVAVGIRNRGTLRGVYGVNAKHVYHEPEWVWNMARKAWKESEYNRIHSGYMWENIKKFGKPKWYNDVVEVYRHKDHIFFIEKRRTKCVKANRLF